MRVPLGADGLFDEAYYRAQVVDPPTGDREALLDHYLDVGWRAGIDPHPSFSTEAYLLVNPDVAVAGLNPLVHWFAHGMGEGRKIVSVREAATTDLDGLVSADLMARRSTFVRLVAGLGLDIDDGDIRLRAPSVTGIRRPPPWFDAEFYLARYSDVRRAEVDPYWHFFAEGSRESRCPNNEARSLDAVPRNDFDAVLAARSWCGDHAESSTEWEGANGSDLDVLASALAACLQAGDVTVALTHDDYVANVGGIQLCVGLEEEDATNRGADYLALFPVASRPRLAAEATTPALRGRLNGRELELDFGLDTLADAFESIRPSGPRVGSLVVHSVFGHSPESVHRFVRRTNPDRLLWWVHDYAAQCANPKLMRNDVHWCASPPLDAQCCELCVYGTHRADHVRRVHALLGAFEWDVVAPSEAAADVASSGTASLASRPRVVPHGRLVVDTSGTRPRSRERLRIAFVGYPHVAKGWMEFRRLVDEFPDDEAEFFHMGSENTFTEKVRFVEVRQVAGNVGIVTDALIEHGIHVVVNWARWAETFSFVTFEAMAAGCFIVTHRNSGNVAAAAEEAGRLLSFDSIDDVHAPGALARAVDELSGTADANRGRIEYSVLPTRSGGCDRP